MLFRILDQLRARPKGVRQRYAFASALIITLLIGGVWSLTLPARFAQTDSQLAAGTIPFGGFFDRIKDSWQSLVPPAAPTTETEAVDTITTTIDALSLLGSTTSTTTRPTPAVPVMIGTTSTTTDAR
jgi:hypothetical protein